VDWIQVAQDRDQREVIVDIFGLKYKFRIYLLAKSLYYFRRISSMEYVTKC
jgi:hypothetical protein